MLILVDWVESEDIVQKTRRQGIFGVKDVMMFTQVCQLLDSVFWEIQNTITKSCYKN
jgi:hypothetical protein